MTSPLFKPLQLGAISLSHRVVMAPLTSKRAGAPDNVPTELSVEYYRQRASTGGLIISEASQLARLILCAELREAHFSRFSIEMRSQSSEIAEPGIATTLLHRRKPSAQGVQSN